MIFCRYNIIYRAGSERQIQSTKLWFHDMAKILPTRVKTKSRDELSRRFGLGHVGNFLCHINSISALWVRCLDLDPNLRNNYAFLFSFLYFTSFRIWVDKTVDDQNTRHICVRYSDPHCNCSCLFSAALWSGFQRMLGEVYQPTGHRFEAGELMPEKNIEKCQKSWQRRIFLINKFWAVNKGDPLYWLVQYSGDLKSALVWILNGQKEVGLQMVLLYDNYL